MKNVNASASVSETRKSSKPVRSFKTVLNWNPPSTRLKRVTLSRSISGNATKLTATPAPSHHRPANTEPSLPYSLDLAPRRTLRLEPPAVPSDSGGEQQVTSRIWEELKKDFGNGDSSSTPQLDASTHASPVSSLGGVTETLDRLPQSPRHDAVTQATAAVALIQQIETFVRSGRPGLAIQLDGRLAARIEIERLGRREVALRLVGKNGPPSAENVGRIRDELRRRGIRIGAITVA